MFGGIILCTHSSAANASHLYYSLQHDFFLGILHGAFVSSAKRARFFFLISFYFAAVAH